MPVALLDTTSFGLELRYATNIFRCGPYSEVWLWLQSHAHSFVCTCVHKHTHTHTHTQIDYYRNPGLTCVLFWRKPVKKWLHYEDYL